MAWSYESSTQTAIEGNVQRWEWIEVEQVESTTAGYIRLRVTSHASAWNGDNPYYTGIIWASRASVTCGEDTYFSDTQFAQRESNGSGVWRTSAVEVSVPSSLAGESVSVSGAVRTWSGITLGALPSYALAISKGDNVSSLVVTRTTAGTEWSTLAELNAGAILYKGDVLTVTATAKLGYKLSDFASPITVGGDVAVIVTASPQATLHLYESTEWVPYLLHVFTGEKWELHQAYVYNGSAWEPYF